MSAQSPEMISQLAVLRQAAVDGSLTREQTLAAMKMLRADRVSAVRTTPAKGAKPKAPIPSADDMLNDLMK